MDKISAEMIQAGGKTLCSGIHNFINLERIWNMAELPKQWKISV
jgi:hypothetical protein